MGLFDILNSIKKDFEKKDNLYGPCGGYYRDCTKEREILNNRKYERNDLYNDENFNPYFEDGFVMDIEDIFTITGRGTVVTGRIQSGELRINDRIKIQRNGTSIMEVNVAGIEMFRKMLDYAKVGDNVGVLLRGVNRNDLMRGDKLIK